MWQRHRMTFRYAAYGALFGLIFPVASTLGYMLIHGLPFTLQSVVWVQKSDPLHWMVDTAPFSMSLFAIFLGRRQVQLAELNASLRRRIEERDQAVRKAQSLQADLERQVKARSEQLAQEHIHAYTIEENYRTLFEGMPIGLYRTTAEGEILDVNPALIEMLGHPDREALLSASAASIYVDSTDRETWKSLMAGSGVVKDFEAQFRRADGTTIWTRDNAHTVHDGEGNVLYYEGSLENITERRQASEAVLGRDLTTIIPHESATFIQAINHGQPFVADMRSKAGLAISSLAYQLSAAEMEAAKASYESPLLSRARKRSRLPAGD